MEDYWLRHMFAKGTNKGILELFETTIGINTDDWFAHSAERIRLPLTIKGCGLREEADRRHGQFVGTMLQSFLPLMDQTDSDNCIIPGRRNIPAVKDLFVKDFSTTLAQHLGRCYSDATCLEILPLD